MEKYANILLLGRTGVGKSSFINYIIGEEKCATGFAKPVTQYFDEFLYKTKDGIPLRIYDSKGIETINSENQCNEIKKYIATKCSDENIFNWLHSIFFCVNLKRKRLEDKEVNFIKDLQREISQTIHIIITNCPEEETEDIRDMKKYIRDSLGDDVRICCVNSVETRNRKGVVPAFGRKEVLNEIFEMLWSDISKSISKKYAKEYIGNMKKLIREIRYQLYSVADRLNGINAIKDIISDNGELDEFFDRSFEYLEKEMDKMQKNLSKKFVEIITPLADFCRDYSRSANYNLSVLSYDDFLFDLDLFDVDEDEIFENSSFSQKIKKMEEVAEDIDDSGFSIVKGIFKTVVGAADILIHLKSMMKEIANEYSDALEKSIPSEKEIAEEVYDVLMQQMEF